MVQLLNIKLQNIRTKMGSIESGSSLAIWTSSFFPSADHKQVVKNNVSFLYSSKCYNFQSIGLSPPMLSLFLGIWPFFFFLINFKWDCFLAFSSDMELPKITGWQSNLEKNEQSRRNHAPWLHNKLQSYSKQNILVLAQE